MGRWGKALRIVVGAVVIAGLAGASYIFLVPHSQAAAGPLPVADTVKFGQETMLSWGDRTTGQAAELTAVSRVAAALGMGNETAYGWGNGVTNVFSGDFNGDGKWDIGVTGTAAEGERSWYIRYGDGKGSFGGETSYWWGNGVTNAFSGDFDGDGKWDIGVTGTNDQKDRYWYIRYGDGKGGFGRETSYWWGNGVTNAFTGDFNGDGKWDIGVTGTADQQERYWYIRYGDGQGRFGSETSYWWGNGVTNAFTGDFNGDGKWDIGVTGTANQHDGTWYVRYGKGDGQFAGEETYSWGNGDTNIFTGDFNGDKLWDIGVTGDRVRRNGTWYIRYNSSKRASGEAAGGPPAGVDAAAQLRGAMADVAFQKLLGRRPSDAEYANYMASNLSPEEIWTNVARSDERLAVYGFWAPARVDYDGKRERCFGAVGPKCDGVWGFTPDPVWVDKFTRPDGVEMGYMKLEVVVGSILHDNTCLRGGVIWCSGIPAGVGSELNLLTKSLEPAAMEWNKAVWNTVDHRGWMAVFGPYPTDKQLFEQYSDDLTPVPNRAAKMAPVNVMGTPRPTIPFQNGETRQSLSLKAPATAAIDRGDTEFCESRKSKDESNFWVGKEWSICK